jgi:hypothetical protein
MRVDNHLFLSRDAKPLGEHGVQELRARYCRPAMRLKLILPALDLDAMPEPVECPRPGCGCLHVVPHQPVREPLCDTRVVQIPLWRYKAKRAMDATSP